ncbi:motor axon guidance molcule sidestep isoform X2 [Haematobia irritans]|uniref:motor axon guidance molcule sidestep isoform X2 n=1 Tax=Haematobia irritans TaxID=7368 RepID=UPI003F4F71A5
MVLTVRRLKMEAWQFYTNTNKIKLMPDPQSQYQQEQEHEQQQQQKGIVKEQRPHYTHRHHHYRVLQKSNQHHHHQHHQYQELQYPNKQQTNGLQNYGQEQEKHQQYQQCHRQQLQHQHPSYQHQHQHQLQHHQPSQELNQTPHTQHLKNENIQAESLHGENHIFITNVNQNCYTASRIVSKQAQKTIKATTSEEEDCCSKPPSPPALESVPETSAIAITPTSTSPSSSSEPIPGPTEKASNICMTTISNTTLPTVVTLRICQPKCKQTIALLDMCCHHHTHQHHQSTTTIQNQNMNSNSNLYQQCHRISHLHQQGQQEEFQQSLHHRHHHRQPDYLPSLYANKSLSVSKRLCSFMEHLLLIASLLIALSGFVAGDPESQDFQKNIPARLVWAAVGKSVDLPCDMTPPTPQDSVKLLLWFKDTTGIPLYSLDSRGGNVKLATHSAIASDLGQRLFFSIGDNPKDSRLQIRDVKPTDGGVYRCRIDFFNFPTRNYRINLTLVVPPEEPRIFDAQGSEITQAGPFREGYEMFLCCQVKGGRPPPKVTWWQGDTELIGTSHTSVEEGATVIVNQLLIGTTPREYYGTKIQCRAQGTKLIEPVVKEVALQVYLKPLKVKIITPNDLLTAGHPVPLRCESTGSHPPAKITWLMDGEPIRNPEVIVREDTNKTTSILTLKVTSENDNAELTCRASNIRFSGGAIEDKRVIRVAYPPTVSVHLANEDPSRVVTRAEGQNVTFKCRADARPPVTSYSWFKNGMRMSGESSEIMHLTQLERESAGAYACGATNTEGETRSSSITLRVQYSPRCKPGTEQTSIGAINMHSIPVKCEVDADPPDSVKFSWTYNNTRNVSPVLNSRIQSNGLVSTVTYLPQTDSELITLACWASNAVGRQTTPCLVHILPANPPEAPRSCEIRNDTVLEVVCIAGSDGGLSQYFVLEVVGGDPLYGSDSTRSFNDANPGENEISTMNDQATSAPIFRMQESNPQFRLNNLEPGREYQFHVYAVNAKGRSDPPVVIERVRVAAQLGPYDESILSEDPTPAETTHHVSSNVGVAASGAGASIGNGPEKQSTLLLLAAVVAIGAVIVTSIIVAGIVVVCKHRPRAPQPQDVRKSMRPARSDVPSMYIEEEELNDEEAAMSGARAAEIRARVAPINMMPRCSTSTASSQHHYISEGFIQYPQPSLNGDVLLPLLDCHASSTANWYALYPYPPQAASSMSRPCQKITTATTTTGNTSSNVRLNAAAVWSKRYMPMRSANGGVKLWINGSHV